MLNYWQFPPPYITCRIFHLYSDCCVLIFVCEGGVVNMAGRPATGAVQFGRGSVYKFDIPSEIPDILSPSGQLFVLLSTCD